MKLNHSSSRFFFPVLVGLLTCAHSGSAQMFDNPITAKVWYFVRGEADGSPGPYVDMDFGGTAYTQYFNPSAGAWEDGDQEAKIITLGQEYTFAIDSNNMIDFEFVFDLPPNMEIYIDGVATNVIHSDDISYLNEFTVQVLPSNGKEVKGFGLSTGLDTGKLLWKVGLGKLVNGESAGMLILSQTTINSTAYKPDALEYTDQYDEVDVVLSSGILRQINVPQGLLDIVTINTSKYEIDVYGWTQITGFSGGLYTTSGSPYVTYTIDNPGYSGGDRIRIQKDVGADVYETIGKKTGDDWEILDWHDTSVGALRRVFRDYQSSTLSETTVFENGTANTFETQVLNYGTVSGGTELTQREVGTTNAPITGYDYKTSGIMGDAGKPETLTLACGNEVDYTYYTKSNYASPGEGPASIGEVYTETRPFLDGGGSENIVTTYTYNPSFGKPLVESITEVYTGITPSEVVRAVDITYAAQTCYTSNDGLKITRTEKYNEDTTAKLTTVTKVFRYDLGDSFLRNQVYSRENPDGTKTSYLYQTGDWNDSTHTFSGSGDYKRITIVPGLTAAVGGVTTSVSTINGGNIDTVHCTIQKTLAKAIVKDPSGNVIWEENYVFNTSGVWERITCYENTYDTANNLTKRERMEYISPSWVSTTLYEASYTDNFLDYTIDEAGTKITYTYDTYGRVLTATKIGWDEAGTFFDQNDITATYFYDADNNVVKEEVKGSGNAEKITTSYTYDDAGRRTQMTAPGGYETDYQHYSCSKKITITYPDGSTETRDFFKDGRPKTVSGSAVPDTTYSYSILATADYEGYLSSKVTFDETYVDVYNPAQWAETWTDWLGRTTKAIKPTWDGGADVHQVYTYNTVGQLTKIDTFSGTSATKLAPSKLFAYNDQKMLYREAVDTDNDGNIDTDTDRLKEYYFHYEDFGSIGWYKYEDVHFYNDYGSGSAPNKKTKTQFSYTRMSDFPNTMLSQVHATDENIRTVITTSEVDRANKKREITVDNPYGSTTADAVQTYRNGLLAISKTIEGSSNYVDHKYGYDHLGRLKTHDDPRFSGNTTTSYYSTTREVYQVTTPDSKVTTYDYDSTSGRMIWARNNSSKYTRFQTEYSGEDRWEYTWGDVPSPVKVKYDDLGRKVEMHTYKTGTWNGGTKPAGFSSAGNKTTWVWDSETGLLNSSSDAANNTTSYKYYDLGEIDERNDGNSEITEYYYYTSSYAGSAQFTGELRTIDYPSTTDVTYTYTRWGAPETIVDSTGTRTFDYNANMRLDKETLGIDYDVSGVDMYLKYTYETSSIYGRVNNFSLYKNPGAPTLLLSEAYEWDGVTGRLDKVTGQGKAFDIYYLANSHLISEVENGSFERHYTRESNSNRHSKIENEWSNVDRVGVDYVYDSLGRVSTRELFGNITDAYGTTIDKVRDTFTYNDRNEMTHVETHVRQSSVYQELVARDHLLVYDAQGNRTSHQRNGHATTYEVNSLNQYTSRDNTNYLAVEGTSTNATVKVYETGQTETTATRKDRYYYRDWSLGSSVDDYPEINVKEGTTVTYTGKAWIPGDEWEENDAILYDDNGNLTKDALWNYTYDDENRLVKMEETTGAASAGFPDTTITFKYDYMGRRAEKKVMRGMSTESHLRFVWKGWMLIAELNVLSSNALLKTYTWGPDISGGFGAGGNGGVLLVKDHVANESFYPAYDMQGNVYGLIDMSGNLDAEYEYDPFGKLIRYSGPRKTSMSLLYSTKYTDMESGLIYYGHRYYDPRQGRFINRDPIGETGGINLYGMVGNNLANNIDFLGMFWWYGDDYWEDDEEFYDDDDDYEKDVVGPTGTLDVFTVNGYDQDLQRGQDRDWNSYLMEGALKDIRENPYTVRIGGGGGGGSGKGATQGTTSPAKGDNTKEEKAQEEESEEKTPEERKRECDEARELVVGARSVNEFFAAEYKTRTPYSELQEKIIQKIGDSGGNVEVHALMGFRVFGFTLMGGTTEAFEEKYSPAMVDILNSVELDNGLTATRMLIQGTTMFSSFIGHRGDVAWGMGVSLSEGGTHGIYADKLNAFIVKCEEDGF